MFEVEIGGKKQKAEISFYTAQLYEAEFGKDIIQDFFGTSSKDEGSAIEFAIEKDEDTGEEHEVLARIDFTAINWLASIRVLWAAIKTADEGAPSFKAWEKSCSGGNMWEIRMLVAEEMSDCFFRSEAS